MRRWRKNIPEEEQPVEWPFLVETHPSVNIWLSLLPPCTIVLNPSNGSYDSHSLRLFKSLDTLHPAYAELPFVYLNKTVDFRLVSKSYTSI